MTFSIRKQAARASILLGKCVALLSQQAALARRVRWPHLAIPALVLSVSATPAIAAGPARLGDLKVMLWYQETGHLSESIAPPRSVNLFNTCIGEGDAREIANDVLFTVEVRTNGEQSLSQPITLTATNSRGAVIARRVVNGVLTSANGRASLPLLVNDVGCGVGTVIFSARLGNQNRTVTLNFGGGE